MEDQRKEGGEVGKGLGPLCREGVSRRRWESEGIRSELGVGYGMVFWKD